MPSGADGRLAILASGGGSNADAICSYFEGHPGIRIPLIITNNPEAGVIRVAARHRVKMLIVPRGEWHHPAALLRILTALDITHIALAGFLQLIHPEIIHAYAGRIINIHPALLPRFGGKGMYGQHVHRAVKAAGVPTSGITIHEVNEQYDEGRILFQAETPVDPADTWEDIAALVLRLEHRHYPQVIEQWIRDTAGHIRS